MMNLQKFLSDRKITQAAFAGRLGVNQATVSKLCGPRPKISPDLAVRIENATGGAVPVESWPSFQPLLHRAALQRDSARTDFLPNTGENITDGTENIAQTAVTRDVG